ncbi:MULTISPECIES: hypothetical protein [unclassified Bradyrhizobium]|uniref:hypothetical protein n=1 Tax=unclassified Bradyrhizobium TaxID=2631580 RepID=UPI002916338B|nr:MULTISPECIES: hypothetical protein [unclassified Bradyrhizobium]
MVDDELISKARSACIAAGLDPNERVECKLPANNRYHELPEIDPVLHRATGLTRGLIRPRWHFYIDDPQLRAS